MSNELSDDMIQQLLQLPYEQRGQLANVLIDSLHPSGEDVTSEQWRASWTEECQHRLAQIESGEVATVSEDDVIARMRTKHGE